MARSKKTWWMRMQRFAAALAVATSTVVTALGPAPVEAGCLFPCGIFGLQCRNGGVPPGVVPTSQPTYAAPVAYAPPPVAYAPPPRYAPPPCVPCRPAPRPCVPCRPAPVCVPCNPCPTVCPPVCNPCPTVCPSACPPACGSYDPCARASWTPGAGGIAGYTGGRGTTVTAGYAPVTAWRRELYSVPRTTYRPVVTYDPSLSSNVTYLQPVTTYVRSVQSVPYTTYRRVYPNYWNNYWQGYRGQAAPVYGSPTYSTPAYSTGAAACTSPGCSSAGSCPGGSCGVPSSVPTAAAAPAMTPSLGSAPSVTSSNASSHVGAPTPNPSLLKPPSTFIPAQPSQQRSLEAPGTQPTTPVSDDEPTQDGPRLFSPRDRVTLRDPHEPLWTDTALRPVAYVTYSSVPSPASTTAANTGSSVPAADRSRNDEDFQGWRQAKPGRND